LQVASCSFELYLTYQSDHQPTWRYGQKQHETIRWTSLSPVGTHAICTSSCTFMGYTVRYTLKLRPPLSTQYLIRQW
jgi:hypothetical protein